MQLIYGFDRWHVSPVEERPYALDVIRYCNQRSERNSFAEIGCGLGDILFNVQYREKKGFDYDEKVLKAASFIARMKNQKVEFKHFRFPESPLAGKFDVITMVNWIHHIEPEMLKEKISEYFNTNLNRNGEILIDTVQDAQYKYNHDINFLIIELNCSLYRVGEYQRQREVWAIKKNK